MSDSSLSETIILGGGCFWCLDASYRLFKGIMNVKQGYAGGTFPGPTYEQVCSDTTGHAEVVRIIFNPLVIPLPIILDIFWTLHDPTTLNRQGYDVGTAYRSIILYENDTQKLAIDKSKQSAQEYWDKPIVTEIKPLGEFYPAEDYQNNYKATRPDYCETIINPKLKTLRQKFSGFLK